MDRQFTIKDATLSDLGDIVSIYNSTISSRMVTADTEFIEVESRVPWFKEHDQTNRPLWVVKKDIKTAGWVSFQSFYGRPAYRFTAEISIYLDENYRGQGLGREILAYSLERCRQFNITSLLGFIFAHNEPSLKLFKSKGFEEWAHLPEVAEIDGRKMSLKILGKKIAPINNFNIHSVYIPKPLST